MASSESERYFKLTQLTIANSVYCIGLILGKSQTLLFIPTSDCVFQRRQLMTSLLTSRPRLPTTTSRKATEMIVTKKETKMICTSKKTGL